MSQQRRLKKALKESPQVIVKTQFVWNDIEICLMMPEQLDANVVVNDFRAWLQTIVDRSNSTTVGDMYAAHLELLEKVKNGETLLGAKNGS